MKRGLSGLLAAAGVSAMVLVTNLLDQAGGAGGINPILGAVEFERVPRELQARVLGTLNATAWAGIPIGSLAGGALAEGIGVRGALTVAAASYFVTTLAPFVFPCWRALERVGRPAEPVGSAACSTAPSS